jgi:benzil reductase ((S)-benzoin forming)
MEILTIITGAGTGIGQALARELASRGHDVLAVGRRAEPLEETASFAPERIHTVAADIAMWDGREAIRHAVPEGVGVRYLVHNAAVLDPIGPLATIDEDEWRYHYDVNVHGPLFLTKALLGRMVQGSRILHISTGAAHQPVNGWGAYCTSKAAFHMLWRCLDTELRSCGIRIGSARPGIVDTPMQGHIRESDPSQFPEVDRFRTYKEQGDLLPAEEVAGFLARILLDTDDDSFAGKEWDVRED